MRKPWLAPALFGLALGSAPAGAISIALLPAAASAPVGGSVDLDVVVSGFAADEVLGSYDLDVSFDSSLLAFDDLSFGALLGGPADSVSGFVAGAGLVDLAEFSFLGNAALDALQGASFAIAQLRFTVLAEGTSTVSISQASAAGGVLPDGARVFPIDSLGSARVTGSGVVPEPGGAALFALGLLLIFRRGPGIRL